MWRSCSHCLLACQHAIWVTDSFGTPSQDLKRAVLYSCAAASFVLLNCALITFGQGSWPGPFL